MAGKKHEEGRAIKGFLNYLTQCLVGPLGLLSALEDDTVGTLYSQRDNLNERIGTGLKDHADNAKGISALFQDESFIQFSPLLCFFHRGWKLCNGSYTFNCTRKFHFIQLQTI